MSPVILVSIFAGEYMAHGERCVVRRRGATAFGLQCRYPPPGQAGLALRFHDRLDRPERLAVPRFCAEGLAGSRSEDEVAEPSTATDVMIHGSS